MHSDGAIDHIVLKLIKYFGITARPYKIFLYKDIPISHIRLHKPYYEDPFNYLLAEKGPGKDRILPIIDKIINAVIINNDIIIEQSKLSNILRDINIHEDDVIIRDSIINMAFIQLFSEQLDKIENKKFNDPIIVSNNNQHILNIHPGKTRTSALEYLFLKDKKEYYVDAIFYYNIHGPKGFLIDKEYVEINSITGFINAYGYENIIEFKTALKNMTIDLVKDNDDRYYISKGLDIENFAFLNRLLDFRDRIAKI